MGGGGAEAPGSLKRPLQQWERDLKGGGGAWAGFKGRGQERGPGEEVGQGRVCTSGKGRGRGGSGRREVLAPPVPFSQEVFGAQPSPGSGAPVSQLSIPRDLPWNTHS